MALSDVYRLGMKGVEVNYSISLRWSLKAASLGSASSYGQMSQAYSNGIIVERSSVRRRECLEISAKMGSMSARRILIGICSDEGDFLAENKHRENAACAGCEVAMKHLFNEYKQGGITKERLDVILRHHQSNYTGFYVKRVVVESKT